MLGAVALLVVRAVHRLRDLRKRLRAEAGAVEASRVGARNLDAQTRALPVVDRTRRIRLFDGVFRTIHDDDVDASQVPLHWQRPAAQRRRRVFAHEVDGAVARVRPVQVVFVDGDPVHVAGAAPHGVVAPVASTEVGGPDDAVRRVHEVDALFVTVDRDVTRLKRPGPMSIQGCNAQRAWIIDTSTQHRNNLLEETKTL